MQRKNRWFAKPGSLSAPTAWAEFDQTVHEIRRILMVFDQNHTMLAFILGPATLWTPRNISSLIGWSGSEIWTPHCCFSDACTIRLHMTFSMMNSYYISFVLHWIYPNLEDCGVQLSMPDDCRPTDHPPYELVIRKWPSASKLSGSQLMALDFAGESTHCKLARLANESRECGTLTSWDLAI